MAKESHVSSELVNAEREIAPSLHEAGGATVDVQVSTARRYPRSVTTFVQSATEMATLTPEIAASCVYAIPRDGKTIEGPSARLAEIVASAWGNLRIQAGATSDDGRFITARGEAWDVQNNVAVGFEVKRRVTNRKGETFGDDMIVVTGNAAASIALRNAVFKCVPSPFWRPIYLRCRQVIAGDARTFSSRRDDMLKAFAVVGVTEPRLCAAIGLKGKADITLEHMATLAGILNALKEGETSVEEAFPETGPAVQAAPRKSQQAGFTHVAVQQWAERICSDDNSVLWHRFIAGRAICGRNCADANGPYESQPGRNMCPICGGRSTDTTSASTLAADVAAAIMNTPIPGPKLEDVIRERAAGVVSAMIEKTDAAMAGKVGTIVSVNKRDNGTALVMLSTGFRCGTADAALILTAEGYASTETIVQLVTEAPKTPAHAAKLVEIIGVDDREPGQEG